MTKLPAFAEYFFPAIMIMRSRGGSATIEEMEDDVAELMNLSDEQLAIPHGDGPRTQFQYVLAWVRTYLKKAGAAENSVRGVWSLTDAGERITPDEARLIPERVNAAEAERRKFAKAKGEARDRGSYQVIRGLGEDRISNSLDQATDAGSDWDQQLLTVLQGIAPDQFERLAQRILRESGFTRVEVTGKAGDGGIDGIGILRVNLVSFHVVFQCKRWKGSVGAGTIRDFRGGMVGRADKGLVITTGTFTADARREATRDGAPAIDLVDGEALCGLLKDLTLGVRPVTRFEIDDVFFRAL
jgi:restriction system protein